MKNIVFCSILFVFTNLMFGQSNKQKATLFFRDGTSLSCFARVAGDYIRYVEKDLRGAEIGVNYKELTGIDIWMHDRLFHLVYKTEQGKSKPRLMEMNIDGKMKLYRIADVYNSNIGFDYNSKFLNPKSGSTVYFLETKENQDTVFRFSSNFDKLAKIYFSDCEDLLAQLGKDNFRKKDILKIVIFYNENCGK